MAEDRQGLTVTDASTRGRGSNWADVGVVVAVAVAGLFFWFLYVAVQPRDYHRPFGSPARLETFFGWRAPVIDPSDLIERDRLWLAVAGWLVVGLVAGRIRPRLWILIGPLAVLPALLLYFPTAPHDAEGWWELNVVFLPAAAFAASGVARVASRLDWLFDKSSRPGMHHRRRLRRFPSHGWRCGGLTEPRV